MTTSLTVTTSILREEIVLADMTLSSDVPKKAKDLEVSLQYYEVVLTLVVDALRNLRTLRLKESYDPLVGDTACHIRAFMILDLLKQLKDDDVDELIGRINDIRQRIPSLKEELQRKDLTPGKNGVSVYQGCSLKEVLERNDVNIRVPSVVRVLAYAHLLTITKTVSDCYEKIHGRACFCTKENTADRNLARIYPVAGSFATSIDKLARATIARESVRYVQELAADDPRLSSLVGQERVKRAGRAGDLEVLPLLSSLQVLLRDAMAKDTPIMLSIDRVDRDTCKVIDTINQLYKIKDGKYYPVDMPMNDEYAVIVESASIDVHDLSKESFREDLLRYELVDLLMGNAATHPQYPSGEYEETLDKECMESNIRAAEERGFCPTNPVRCKINHIRPGMIEEAQNARIFNYDESIPKTTILYTTL